MSSTTQPIEERSNTKVKASKGTMRQPSVTSSLFVLWIVPVVLVACLSRFAVNTDASIGPSTPKPVSIDLNAARKKNPAPKAIPALMPDPTTTKTSQKAPSQAPSILSTKPTNYQQVVQAIERRRLDWTSTSSDPMNEYSFSKTESTKAQSSAPDVSRESTVTSEKKENRATDAHSSPTPRGASSDPVRIELLQRISVLRQEHKSEPSDLFKAINLADALRMYDVQYHDGGTAQEEAIKTYHLAIGMAEKRRMLAFNQGEETNLSLSGTRDLNEEISFEYSARSVDGILCALQTALGKTYFMANMFEKAVESYSRALEIEPIYLDAMASRGSSRIILGKYEGAAEDFMTVMKEDKKRRYQDIFTGLARVLQAKESAVPEGWEPMINVLNDMIPMLESQVNVVDHPEGKTMLSNTLNRFYHVLFLYHDVKTKDVDSAWSSLTTSYHYKMSVLPKWNAGFENQKISATKQIFSKGFWPDGVGSTTETPIFIIGFVRSGSTLLERVLDAHPEIVGTGENSVFNGQLDDIRNKIVETSMLGDPLKLANVIESLANDVVEEMRSRWSMVTAGENRSANKDPIRFVDKMLTNYYNVGFIHMLFPNALILHVAREPMDTIFSAYKHEFPPGPLDYTSEFNSLAELYHGYRDLMEHWDRELPGRVTHIRYEDMVHDMPNIARKIIAATGLNWDDGVLEFHKKKQAVNTLSTTQVRKGVYKDSLQAWRRYENHLQPLVKLIGERTEYDLQTSLDGYDSSNLSEDNNKMTEI